MCKFASGRNIPEIPPGNPVSQLIIAGMSTSTHTPIRFIAIDDNLLDLLAISELAGEFPFLQNCGTYTNVIEAAEAIRYIRPDALFLDIEMPGTDGLELLRKMRNEVPIAVFITSHPEFAVEGFELSALDYIVKPLTAERLRTTARRMQEYWEIKQKSEAYEVLFEKDMLSIRDGHSVVRLPQHEIVYLEAMQDYTKIVTGQKTYMTLSTLSSFMETLPADRFVRVHRSYGVSIGHIVEFRYSELLCNDIVIPIGKTYRPAISRLRSSL